MHIIQPQNANKGPNSEGGGGGGRRGGGGGGGRERSRSNDTHEERKQNVLQEWEWNHTLSLLQVLNHITQALGLYGFAVVRLLP